MLSSDFLLLFTSQRVLHAGPCWHTHPCSSVRLCWKQRRPATVGVAEQVHISYRTEVPEHWPCWRSLHQSCCEYPMWGCCVMPDHSHERSFLVKNTSDIKVLRERRAVATFIFKSSHKPLSLPPSQWQGENVSVMTLAFVWWILLQLSYSCLPGVLSHCCQFIVLFWGPSGASMWPSEGSVTHCPHL